MRERVTPTMLGTLFGVNPFRTVRKQYMIDMGLEEEFTEVQKQRMEVGKLMEPIIAKLFAIETGKKVELGTQELLQKGVIAGRVDGITEDGVAVEMKNTTRSLGTCQEDMDKNYFMQCQGYLYILDAPWMWFCYLKNGHELTYFKVYADEEVQNRIPIVAEDYLTSLELGEMPEEPEKEKKKFSEDIENNTGILMLLNKYAELQRQAEPLESELDAIKAQLKEALNKEEGTLETGRAKLTGYVTRRKGSLDTKQIESFFKANNMDVDMFRKEGSESYSLRITVYEDEDMDIEEDLF